MDDGKPTCRFEELGHTAEIGVRVWAPSGAELFGCAAVAMFSLLRVDADTSAAAVTRTVAVQSMDLESLLVDWLSELLYLHEVHGEIYDAVQMLDWTPGALRARVIGWPPAGAPVLHIKAVTYHDLAVQQGEDGWSAQIYFDI